MGIVDIRTGKPIAAPTFTRRKVLGGLAGILATGAAPAAFVRSAIGARTAAWQSGLPYDREVERLISNSVSFIDSGYSLNTLDFKFETSGGCRSMYYHDYVASGTWIGFACGYYMWKDYNTQTWITRDNDSSIVFDSDVGIYINGSLVKSFVTSYGDDIVTTQPLLIMGNYDFYDMKSKGGDYQSKYYRLWLNGVQVLDCIPVVKGDFGYLYDRISGKLLGNAGTGKLGWIELDGTIVNPTT